MLISAPFSQQPERRRPGRLSIESHNMLAAGGGGKGADEGVCEANPLRPVIVKGGNGIVV
jgi:hypothetical protein